MTFFTDNPPTMGPYCFCGRRKLDHYTHLAKGADELLCRKYSDYTFVAMPDSFESPGVRIAYDELVVQLREAGVTAPTHLFEMSEAYARWNAREPLTPQPTTPTDAEFRDAVFREIWAADISEEDAASMHDRLLGRTPHEIAVTRRSKKADRIIQGAMGWSGPMWDAFCHQHHPRTLKRTTAREGEFDAMVGALVKDGSTVYAYVDGQREALPLTAIADGGT